MTGAGRVARGGRDSGDLVGGGRVMAGGTTGDRAGDAQQQLYGMMGLAQEQQAAVAAALAGLVAERAALAGERVTLAQQAEAMRAEAASLRRAAGELGPGLARSTQAAAERAVERGLAGAGETVAAAVEGAARPALERLSGMAAQAGAVEASLRRIAGWASWRLLGRGLAVVGVLAGLLWGAELSVWWWAERDLGLAQARRSLLLAEIAGLQGQRDELEASRAALEGMGALAKIGRCDPGKRPCIRVNEAAGTWGSPPDYRVILGY